MLRIAFIIDTIESPTAGTEKQLLFLLRHLDRTRFEPILCVLYSSPWLEESFELCPLHVIDIRSFKKPNALVAFFRFVLFLKKRKVDVVHTFFRDGNIVGILAGKLAKVKRIISARRNQGYWMSSMDLRVTRFLNRWVDVIIANSLSTKDWVFRTERYPSEKIQVIHNGIDLTEFQGMPDENRRVMREDFGIPQDAFVVGMVANLRPVKAHDVLLKAAQKVIHFIPETHFLFVGDGDQRERLVQIAKDLGLTSNVLFLGIREDVPNILGMLDIGMLSSNSESLSNALVEYLAAGLPVVCTNVGGAEEAIENGVNGYLVNPGDHEKMAEKIILLYSKDLKIRIRKANLEKAGSLYSSRNMHKKHEEIYSNKT